VWTLFSFMGGADVEFKYKILRTCLLPYYMAQLSPIMWIGPLNIKDVLIFFLIPPQLYRYIYNLMLISSILFNFWWKMLSTILLLTYFKTNLFSPSFPQVSHSYSPTASLKFGSYLFFKKTIWGVFFFQCICFFTLFLLFYTPAILLF
jgi:hypothetical protein